MKTLEIKGFHCQACQTLITMELEEAGLNGHINQLNASDENIGTLELKDSASAEDTKKITSIINAMGGYSATEIL